MTLDRESALDRESGPAGRHRALMRVLSAVAWADGDLSREETDAILDLARSFGLSASETAAIEQRLSEPASLEEFETAAREMLLLVRTPEQRGEILREVEALVASDRRHAPEEVRYLSLLREWMLEDKSDASDTEATAAAAMLLRKAQGIFGGIRRAAVQAVDETRQGPVAAALNAALQRRPGAGAAGLNLSPARRAYVVLFGALLDRVMRADGVSRPQEEDRIRWILSESFGFSGLEVQYALDLILAKTAAGVDRQHICAEFNRLTDMDDRLRLLSALFAVGLSDGELSGAEEREIRLIANYLWIETQEYVRVRREAVGRPGRDASLEQQENAGQDTADGGRAHG